MAGWLAMIAVGALAAGLVQAHEAVQRHLCVAPDPVQALVALLAAPAVWGEAARSPGWWAGVAAASVLAGLALLCWPGGQVRAGPIPRGR
jgi:hypothetical protein